jgi:hypothetical protein
VNPPGVADVCERYTNQTDFVNDTENCTSCRLQALTFGLSSTAYCYAPDYVVGVFAPLVFLVTVIVYIVMTKMYDSILYFVGLYFFRIIELCFFFVQACLQFFFRSHSEANKMLTFSTVHKMAPMFT